MKEGGGGGEPTPSTCATFHVVFDSGSSFFVPKPHRNACYAGYHWRYGFEAKTSASDIWGLAIPAITPPNEKER